MIMPESLKIISLGAGVQSTTLALMCQHGEFEMPDAAIFADTGWEPTLVYEHLKWLEKQVSFPVYRVSAGNIRDDILKKNQNGNETRIASVPWFIKIITRAIVDYDEDENAIFRGEEERTGLGSRQCTREYKIAP